MLMQIGPVACDLTFNTDGHSTTTRQDYVDKPVVGIRPPKEHVGEGPESFSIRGRLFPRRLGGLGPMGVLRAVQKQASPQLIVRGDGAVLGWYVLIELSDDHAYLDGLGVGQMIDFSAEFEKAGQPNGTSVFRSLFSLVR